MSYTAEELAMLLGEDPAWWADYAHWLSETTNVELSAEQAAALSYLQQYRGTSPLLAEWRALSESPGWMPNTDQVTVALFTKRRQEDYSDYLRSEHWAELRARYEASRLPAWCCGCGSFGPGLELHHITYRRLGNERLTDVRLACSDCHRAIHARAISEGISIADATNRARKDAERAGLLPTCSEPGCGSVKTTKDTGWTRCKAHRSEAEQS